MLFRKKMTMTQTNLYEESLCFRSYDLALAACLLVKGFKLVSLEKNKEGRALFTIMREEGLSDVIDSYWDFSCPVDAQSYQNQMKRLKNQIYSS